MLQFPMLGTDGELGPVNLMGLSASDLVQYEHALCSLGTKRRPTVGSAYGEPVNFHPDGLYAEFAPRSPSSTVSDFLATITNSRQVLEAMMGMELRGYDYVDVSQIPDYSRETCPRLVRLANTFGCSPDAIGGKWRVVPPSVKRGTIKEAGCHLHLNLPERYCDQRSHRDQMEGRPPTNLRIAAQIAEEFYEATAFAHVPNVRDVRQWYRVPRVYRPKPYGLEYRSIGASVYDDPDKLAMLATISFAFMAEVFATARRTYA